MPSHVFPEVTLRLKRKHRDRSARRSNRKASGSSTGSSNTTASNSNANTVEAQHQVVESTPSSIPATTLVNDVQLETEPLSAPNEIELANASAGTTSRADTPPSDGIASGPGTPTSSTSELSTGRTCNLVTPDIRQLIVPSTVVTSPDEPCADDIQETTLQHATFAPPAVPPLSSAQSCSVEDPISICKYDANIDPQVLEAHSQVYRKVFGKAPPALSKLPKGAKPASSSRRIRGRPTPKGRSHVFQTGKPKYPVGKRMSENHAIAKRVRRQRAREQVEVE